MEESSTCSENTSYDEFVLCKICNARFRTPRMLPCLHSFCQECLEKHIDSSILAVGENISESETKRNDILTWVEGGEKWTTPLPSPQPSPRRRRHQQQQSLNNQQQQQQQLQVKQKRLASFPCPVCNRNISPRNPLESRDEWASGFGVHEFMSRFVTALEIKESEKTCDICYQRGSRNLASNWCRNCYQAVCKECAEIHLAFASSDTHDIISLSKLQSTNIGSLMRKPVCPSHERLLEFYCETCHCSACYLCFVDDHKSCGRMMSLKDQADNDRKQCKDKLVSMMDRLRDKELHQETIANLIEELNLKRKQLVDQVREKTDELVRTLEAKAGDFMKEIETATCQQIAKLEQVLQIYDADIKLLTSGTGLMAEALQSACDADFISVKRDIETALPQTDKNPEYKKVYIQVDLNREYMSGFENLQNLSIGRILMSDNVPSSEKKHLSDSCEEEIQKEGSSNLCCVQTHPIGPVLIQSFPGNVKEVSYEEQHSLRNVAVSEDGHIIVTDTKNMKVKKFSRHGQLLAQITLPNDPFSACAVGRGEVAVTLPYSRKIVFLKEQANQFALARTITTHKKYATIAPLDTGRLVCGSFVPKCVDVIDHQGSILSSFTKLSGNYGELQCPIFISIMSEKAILISDLGRNSLICCDLHGRVRFMYSGDGDYRLKYPRAVSCDDNGYIYLADGEANRVYRFTPDGCLQDVFLSSADDIDCPLGLFATSDNKLLLTEARTGYVKIYQIPPPF